MKRIFPLLFSMAILASACASPAATASAPIEQVESTSQSAQIDTSTPEPAATTPPATLSPRWYWVIDVATAKVIAVNQFGDKREVGQLDPPDYPDAVSFPLDAGHALLLLDANDTLLAYLLTPDGMREITLPSDPFYFNTDLSQSSRAVIAVHGDHVIFSFVTQPGSNVMPDRGPIFLVDLKSLTARLIDESVSRGPYNDSRRWIHSSQDGRYLRYLNGDEEKMDLRELDLETGDARTVYTTRGSSFGMYASPQGDLWYSTKSNIILDLNGNQISFTDESRTVRPLNDGRAIVYPRDCVDTCEIKVITPFGEQADLTYNFPWAIESGGSYNRIDQLLPDQSLLFVGQAYTSSTPALMQAYPKLTELDQPIFRLTPDGQARPVGIHVEGDFASNVSPDGQLILMKSTDQTSFFLYDAVADRSLFSMPVDAGLEDYLTGTKFFDGGILVNWSASVPGTKHSVYRNFFQVYYYKTTTTLAWEDVNLEYDNCPDLLEDGSVVCWLARYDTNSFDLIRYDPVAGTKSTLLENAWQLDYLQ